MIGGMVKKLIIVTGEKENVYAELLSSLISINYDNTKNVQVAGTKGESIEAIVWTEKIYNQNKIENTNDILLCCSCHKHKQRRPNSKH